MDPFGLAQNSATALLSVVVGVFLIFLGRRIFWVFVGGVGFIVGLQLAPVLAPNQPQWIALIVSIVLGIIGAVLAIVLQRVAVAVAGWFAGGILAGRLVALFGLNDSTLVWIACLIGAILAAVIVSFLFDWALIGLTTLSGAVLICDKLPFSPMITWIIGAILVAVGTLVQIRDLPKSVRTPKNRYPI